MRLQLHDIDPVTLAVISLWPMLFIFITKSELHASSNLRFQPELNRNNFMANSSQD